MPVRRVQVQRDGQTRTGYRWGNTGRIYVGRGARERARRQGRAARRAGYRG